jgi:hypothetical protein
MLQSHAGTNLLLMLVQEADSCAFASFRRTGLVESRRGPSRDARLRASWQRGRWNPSAAYAIFFKALQAEQVFCAFSPARLDA